MKGGASHVFFSIFFRVEDGGKAFSGARGAMICGVGQYRSIPVADSWRWRCE